MTDSLAVDVRCQVSWVFQDSNDLGTITDSARLEYARPFLDGMDVDQADRLWYRQSSLASGASDDWNLSALPKTLFGSTIVVALVKVKLIQVIHLSTAEGSELRVSGGGASGWSAFLGGTSPHWKIPADSCGLAVNRRDGWTVAPGTADTLRIHNASASATEYQLVLVGTSA